MAQSCQPLGVGDQNSALQLLQQVGYQYLPPFEALELRDGRRSRVVLESILHCMAKTIRDPQQRVEAEARDFLRAEDSEEVRLDFHALRHTCASWLIESGADVKTVQSVMRHSETF